MCPNDKNTISLTGIHCEGVIGVYDYERTAARPLVIDIVMTCDLSKAAISDDVADTVDYAKVVEAVREYVARSQFELLEALAGSLCTLLLQQFAISHIALTLHKPAVIEGVDDIAVTLNREASC